MWQGTQVLPIAIIYRFFVLLLFYVLRNIDPQYQWQYCAI